jgi:cytochrome oxidase assembly protein ShyY1
VFLLLFTPRWLSYLALTAVFAVVASMFGLWQWDRRTQAVSAITVLEANWAATPIPLEQWSGLSDSLPLANEWQPVFLQGEYVEEGQLLARTRPRSGQVGFEVLVPFRTTTGPVVLVNRGWVATGAAQDFPDVVPTPPSGVVTLTGRLKPSEPLLPRRGAPAGQVASIYLKGIAEQYDYPLETKFFVLLANESPAPAEAPLPAVKPQLDEGPHLSYTLQWFVFAGLAFIGFFWLLRQEYRASQGIDTSDRPGQTDNEEEDSLLEARSS